MQKIKEEEKKMIVMDLDGTLLNNDKTVSEQSRIYLNNLKEEGYITVIATGRILKSAIIATNGAEFANYIVCEAGAATYKNTEKTGEWKEIYEKLISKEIVNDILSQFDEKKFRNISVCSKDSINMYSKKYDSSKKITGKYNSKEELLKDTLKTTHISAYFFNNEFTKEYVNIFTQKYPELSIRLMQDSFDDKQWIEISQKGVEKYNGIYKIAQIENIKNENIIAFGDGLNDVEMIEKCWVGVAMKNALAEVKEKADYITEKSNFENGIIEFLKNYYKN